MRKIRKQFLALLMSGIVVIMGSFCPLTVYASETKAGEEAALGEWNWAYGYTGTEQIFKAPYSGIYQFEIYGAQGGSAGSNEGGKGGKVTAAVALSRGEEIAIYVGGTDGYNGGGSGTVSNGGGATDIRKGGNEITDRILVAGGGGGANKTYPGENGGLNTSGAAAGTWEGETSSEGAGGGSGYLGGAAGTEHIVPHIHTGYGGSCYVPEYHSHIGNEAVYGGCYVIEQSKMVYTSHNWRVTGRGETVNWSGEIVEGEGWTHYIKTTYPVEDEHGHKGEIDWCSHATGARANMEHGWGFHNSAEYGAASGKLTEEPLNFTFSTGKETPVVYYVLGCGQTTDTITGYHLDCAKIYDEYEVRRAGGGTNYHDDTICSGAVSESGVQAGNGACSIKLLALYHLYYGGSESLHIYYDGIKVKKVYYKESLVYLE